MDRPKPTLGARQEGHRRHHIERGAEVQRAEPCADQAHVVIERQPTHHDVSRTGVDRPPDGPNVGKQIGVAQNHTLRIAGAARRVLDQRHCGWILNAWQASHCRRFRKACYALDRIDRCDHRAQYRAKPQSLGYGDQNPRAGIAQNTCLAPRILLDLRKLHRRVDRYRHRADIKNAKERCEEIRSGWKHEGNPIARLDIALDQPGRYGRRRPCKPGVAQCGNNGAVVLEDGSVQPVGVPRHMPIEHFEQSSGLGGRLHLR